VEWNDAKNLENQRKHGISFGEAKELFAPDSDYLEIFDEVHSGDEDRFVAIGPVRRGLIVVVWAAPDDNTIRIISARWANQREHTLYRRYMEQGR
jgi:uncharacterized DUF497 family protein